MRKSNKYAEINSDFLTDDIRAYFDKHTNDVKLKWFLRTLKEMVPDSTGKIVFNAEKLVKSHKYRDEDLPVFLEKIFLEHLQRMGYSFHMEKGRLHYFYTKGAGWYESFMRL